MSAFCSFSSQVGGDIRDSHTADGLKEVRSQRKNHDNDRVGTLLDVPRYAELLEPSESESSDTEGEQTSSRLINSRAAWRRDFARWANEEQSKEFEAALQQEGSDDGMDLDDDQTQPAAAVPRPPRPWLPMTLAKLFGGKATRPAAPPARPRAQYDREALLMELLAADRSRSKAADPGDECRFNTCSVIPMTRRKQPHRTQGGTPKKIPYPRSGCVLRTSTTIPPSRHVTRSYHL